MRKKGIPEKKYPMFEEEEKLPQLFRAYKQNKNVEIRNQILEICYPMVDHVLSLEKYANYDKELLMSYAVEGLISAIEKYSFSSSYSLKEFLHLKVDAYLNRGISLEVYHLPVLVSEYFASTLRELGFSPEENMAEHPEFLNDILDHLIFIGKVKESDRDRFLQEVLWSYHCYDSIEEHIQNPSLIEENHLDDELYIKELRQLLLKAMELSCNEVQKELIRKRFGLNGETPLGYQEVDPRYTR